MYYSLAQLQALSRQAGWPENLIAKAAAMWKYESGGDPSAHNPRGEDSWGLCQVNWPYHKEYNRARLVEPLYNLQACYAIYRREGWNAWYNSNRKYNNNYEGTAAQSHAIYNNGGGSTVVNTAQLSNAMNNADLPTPQQEAKTDTALVLALILLGAVLIKT